jgi:hypothetical protein
LSLNHGRPLYSKISKWWTSSKWRRREFSLFDILRTGEVFFNRSLDLAILLALNHGRPLFSKISKCWASSKWQTKEFSLFDILRTGEVFFNLSLDLSLSFHWL